MRYSAASVANAFLSKAFAARSTVSPMKIQKLIYIAHGYSLVEHDEPLLDEVFEAWKFGPVLNSLYHACKKYGQRGITDYLKDEDWLTGEKTAAPLPSSPYANDIVDFVWDTYSSDTAISLSDWTHERGGPWDKVTNGGRNILRHQDVPNSFIKEYFRKNMYAGPDGSETST